jgi:signal transduction histidine kinase
MFSKKINNLKKTLLFRLTILYAGIFSLSALLIFLFCYFKIYSVTMNDLDSELLEEVQLYSSILSEEGLEGVKDEIEEEGVKEDPEEEFYRLLTMKGEIIVSTDLSSWGIVDISESLGKLQNGEVDHIIQTLTIPESDHKARMISAIIGSGIVLQIGETLEDAENYLHIFRNWFLILLFIVMFLSSMIGWLIAKRALLDMEDVTKTALEISKGAYDKRVQVKDRFEEIGRLGGAFNNMLDRIQSLLKSMKEINANIAHDLRSPLTRIRGIAEMSLMKERQVDEYKNMAASTIEECDRLIDMINTMLEITEIESGIRETRIVKLDAAKLIHDACELFQPIAHEKKIKITEDIPDQLNVSGDLKNLQRIISNLLDNAIRYTPDGGTVTITAMVEEKRVNLTFKDTGIGISETDLPHIFERFYQCDRSRSQGGVGLGLSLVKAFTEAMSGTIRVISVLNKGSSFAVTLPQ